MHQHKQEQAANRNAIAINPVESQLNDFYHLNTLIEVSRLLDIKILFPQYKDLFKIIPTLTYDIKYQDDEKFGNPMSLRAASIVKDRLAKLGFSSKMSFDEQTWCDIDMRKNRI